MPKWLGTQLALAFSMLLLCCLSSNAQQYNLRVLSLDEGLSQSQVNVLFEDSRGFIWLGTAGGGLCQHDGLTVKEYGEKDGLPGPIITAIAEDRNGDLWVGATWGGVARFDGQTFTPYNEKNEGLPSNHIAAICLDSAGGIWIGTNRGLAVYRNEEFTTITDGQLGFRGNIVSDVICAFDGAVWVGTEEGVFRYKDDKFVQLSDLGDVTNFTQSSNDAMLFGTNGKGIYRIDANLELKEIPCGGITELTITNLYVDSYDRIWVGTTTEGVYSMRGHDSRQYNMENGLPRNDVRSILEDRSGNMWFGTNGGGAVMYPGERFVYYDNLNGLGNNDIFAVATDNTGALWVGTSSDGVFRYSEDGPLRSLNTATGLSGNNVRSILCTNNGEVWIANEKGVDIYRNGNLGRFMLPAAQADAPVRSLYQDSKGSIWLGTYGKGLLKYNGGVFTHYSTEDGLSHDYIHSIMEDPSGGMWFGTGAGVNELRDGKFTRHSTREGLCNSYVGSMAVDKAGQLWLGTDRCVARYRDDQFGVYTTDEGLASNTIYLTVADKEGNIWVGTNKGVDKLIIDDNGELLEVKNFGRDEGFKGVECNSRATAMDSIGNLYFGTVKGLIKYQPHADTMRTSPPKVHLTGIRSFLSKMNWGPFSEQTTHWFRLPTALKIPREMNHITFDFMAINQTAPEQVKYKFMLEGFDEGWSPPSYEISATYSNLEPGTYTFHLKACNEGEMWSNESVTTQLTIMAPFWSRWWFITLLTIVGIVLLVSALKLRTRALDKTKLELARQIELRTQEIQEQNQEKELLLKEIHHRVKNNLQVVSSLLSIQAGYLDDKVALAAFEESQNRVKTMALIHEKMYQGETLGKINAQDYLESLVNGLVRTYSLNQHVSVDEEISIEHLSIDTLIPLGLIINELFTNSLKYAFEDKKAGKLTMKIEQTSADTYKMLIGDNGVGLKDDSLWKEPVSLGLELVQILLDQINGTMERAPNQGTMFRITFHDVGKTIESQKNI